MSLALTSSSTQEFVTRINLLCVCDRFQIAGKEIKLDHEVVQGFRSIKMIRFEKLSKRS